MSEEKQPMLDEEPQTMAPPYGQPPPPYPPTGDTQYLYQPQIGAAPYNPYSGQPNAQVQAGYYPAPGRATVNIGPAAPSYGSTTKDATIDEPIDDSHSHNRRRNSLLDAAFNEKTIRMAFIRKVYTILLLQILLTAGVVCLFMFISPIRRYCQWHMWPSITFLCISLVLLIVLTCFTEVRRKLPWNWITLVVFTFFEGCFLGSVTVYFSTVDVLMAVAITAVVVVALTIFAMQTKWDFTLLSGCIFVAIMVVLMFGILCLIVQNRFLDIGIASVAALIFMVYIVFDTQMMLGGKHRYSLSPEEYIFASLNLYLDIVNLFLLLLIIIGCLRG